MKEYINEYSKTEEFQRSMILSMLNIFNKKNIEESTKRINQNLLNSSLLDINYISNKVADKLNGNKSIITIEQCKIICDAVLSISKLLDIIKTTQFSKLNIEEEINRIYSEIKILNIHRRTLTKEDFFAFGSDGFEDKSNVDTISYTPPERAQESKLKKYGYSVAWNSPLSTKKRQELLKALIESSKVSKGYVISYLKHNIQINGKKDSNEFAVVKWKEDLEFVYKL